MRIVGYGLVVITIAISIAVVARADDLLDKLGAPANANVAAVKAGDVEATITPSAIHAAPGQQLEVHALLDIAPGWHIYGKPLPQGYTPTAIVFDNRVVATQSLDFPKPKMVSFPALGETLPVYQGQLSGDGKIRIRPDLKAGTYKLAGRLSFQECNDQICKLPQSAAFEMPFTIDASK
jgi:DsbC/DsbD-like thiol-disulfide interchange protein